MKKVFLFFAALCCAAGLSAKTIKITNQDVRTAANSDYVTGPTVLTVNGIQISIPEDGNYTDYEDGTGTLNNGYDSDKPLVTISMADGSEIAKVVVASDAVDGGYDYSWDWSWDGTNDLYTWEGEVAASEVGATDFGSFSYIEVTTSYIEPSSYFHLENIANDAIKVKLDCANPEASNVAYSLDGSTWAKVTMGSEITVPAAYTIYFRACNASDATQPGTNATFNSEGTQIIVVSTGDIAAGGNIMSLLDGKSFLNMTTVPSYTFKGLFENCTHLKDITNLSMPATTLGEACYRNMFNGAGLKALPANLLPATKMAKECYAKMFFDCVKITNIPNNFLPATELAESCYEEMFNGCRGLETLPSDLLPATQMEKECYRQMFYNCSFIKSVPMLPATILAEGCYRGMFRTSGIETVPTDFLPATTLAISCYEDMFHSCNNLICTPELPATTLVKFCYKNMFSGCGYIKQLKVKFTQWGDMSETTATDYQATYLWLNGTGKDVTNPKFICPQELNTTQLPFKRDYSYVPSNWVINEFEIEDPAKCVFYTAENLCLPTAWASLDHKYDANTKEGWIQLTNQTVIPTNAFKDMTSMTKVSIPECIKTISEGAFAGCSGLQEVKFNGVGVTFIDGTTGVFTGVGNDTPAELLVPGNWPEVENPDLPDALTGMWHNGRFHYATMEEKVLGEMGVPCVGCTAIKVTKGDKTVILYAPETIEFIKSVEEE